MQEGGRPKTRRWNVKSQVGRRPTIINNFYKGDLFTLARDSSFGIVIYIQMLNRVALLTCTL
jgi:hypothetical protein